MTELYKALEEMRKYNASDNHREAIKIMVRERELLDKVKDAYKK